jgi:transposase
MWTQENRHRYDRGKLRYPSDLTDEEWSHVAPLIGPAKRGGRERTVNVYILSTGCQWRAIPKDLPPRSTLHDYLELWEWDGTLRRTHHALYVKCREQAGREASPTAAIIDSQSVKSAEKGGLDRPAWLRRGQEAPSAGRHARSAAFRDRPCGRCSGSRRRRAADGRPVRPAPVPAQTLRRRRLPGAAVSEGAGPGPATHQCRDRQAVRPRARVRGPAQALDPGSSPGPRAPSAG